MPRKILFAVLACSLVALSGCGGTKLVPVEGDVKLDGKPVEGATVTFISDDGKNTFAGTTDAAGHFVLQAGEKAGAVPGSYKVTVVKSPIKPGAEAAEPGSPEGMKQMKALAEEASKTSKTGAQDMASKMKNMGKSKGPEAPVVKTELPAAYANGTSTPLTAKVPADQPIQLELKSKP